MSGPAEITFVCWGNICRSPMAEVVARAHAERTGLAGVRFTSAGVSAEEAGNPMDHRAVTVLVAAGYQPGPFTAHRITADEVRRADLLIGMEQLHLSRLRQLQPGATNLRLLSDFNPDAVPGSPIEDPWYGDLSDFVRTLAQVEAAIPEVIRRARELARS